MQAGAHTSAVMPGMAALARASLMLLLGTWAAPIAPAKWLLRFWLAEGARALYSWSWFVCR